MTQMLEHATYDNEYAMLIVRTINEMKERKLNAEGGVSFAETFSLKKGIKVLGEKGEKAAFDEVNQLHQRGCFSPVDVKSLSKEDRERVLESLIFLTETRQNGQGENMC